MSSSNTELSLPIPAPAEARGIAQMATQQASVSWDDGSSRGDAMHPGGGVAGGPVMQFEYHVGTAFDGRWTAGCVLAVNSKKSNTM